MILLVQSGVLITISERESDVESTDLRRPPLNSFYAPCEDEFGDAYSRTSRYCLIWAT